MENKTMGQVIAALRKEKGMTQKVQRLSRLER